MTPKQLEIASYRVLKMLRKRPMPYKCTQLQADTSYTIEERLQILHYLRRQHYIKDISFVDIILTEKGKQSHGYYATRFDKWYRSRPALVRYLISPASATLVTGIGVLFFLEAPPPVSYQPTWPIVHIDSLDIPATDTWQNSVPWYIRATECYKQYPDK